jgi:hypothetical protein
MAVEKHTYKSPVKFMLASEFHLRSNTNVNKLDICFVKLINSPIEINNIPNKSNKI